MNTIKSFQVDHDLLYPGIYLSRVDGNTKTYDLRFCKPNKDTLLGRCMHTIEHIGATFLRNSIYSDQIVYFGPMGCKTGFYLIVFDTMSDEEVIGLVRNMIDVIKNWDIEEKIPGSERKECGNYKYHSIVMARINCDEYSNVIKDWTAEKLAYRTE